MSRVKLHVQAVSCWPLFGERVWEGVHYNVCLGHPPPFARAVSLGVSSLYGLLFGVAFVNLI